MKPNTMSKEEFEKLKAGLDCCQYVHISLCHKCPYKGEGGDPDDPDDENCREALSQDALKLVEMLEWNENARYMLLGF